MRYVYYMQRYLADIGPSLRKSIEQIRTMCSNRGRPVPSVKWIARTALMRGLESVKTELNKKEK